MKKTKALAILLVIMLSVTVCGLTACQTAPVATTVNTAAPITTQTSVLETTADYTHVEASCSRDGLKIYGEFFIPAKVEGRIPTVIFSHGFNSKYKQAYSYAKEMVKQGIAVYCFDFIGGSMESKSDGLTSDMSILTEKADLNTVIDYIKTFDFVDPDNLFLSGISQGGAISALAAAERPTEIKGLLLLFPAFSISADWKALYPNPEEITGTIEFMNATLGKRYAVDAINTDMFVEIAKYTKDVLIFHGTLDQVVAYSNAVKAVEVYQSAELVTLEGGYHTISTQQFPDVISKMIAFIQAHTD